MIHQNDPRSDEMRRKMTDCFATMEGEYRASDWANVVYEDDEVVLIEDTKGYEWGEWTDEFGGEFSEIMHELADQLVDRRWERTYPLVFDKYDD